MQISRQVKESENGTPIRHPLRTGMPPRTSLAGAVNALPSGPGDQAVSRHSQVAATK
ncbi:hypothetical protein RSPO_m00620 (plasmid) [Ralstonia solanacearum Po82]|uniref:Uncharacterized protein n=1 Tax=Ralstonia solanacearum (strain Po82) TaxID=1031711 RepID=F6G8N9_RALS8|nr:hypothetical protein RSPO_m00620 [Ralstonia solanacearum Po82]